MHRTASAMQSQQHILACNRYSTPEISVYMELLYSRFDTTDPTNTRIGDILETHANAVLKTKANIENVRELLQYASKYGWSKVRNLHGMGEVTYSRMIETLCNNHFIIVGEDKNIELSPEIATLLL